MGLASRYFGKHLDSTGVFAVSIGAASIPLRLPLVDRQTLSILRVDAIFGLPIKGRPCASSDPSSAESARIDRLVDHVSRSSVPVGLGEHALATCSKGEFPLLLGRIAAALPGLRLLEDLHG